MVARNELLVTLTGSEYSYWEPKRQGRLSRPIQRGSVASDH